MIRTLTRITPVLLPEQTHLEGMVRLTFKSLNNGHLNLRKTYIKYVLWCHFSLKLHVSHDLRTEKKFLK